jgi:DNA-binding transcriptional MerR regulator
MLDKACDVAYPLPRSTKTSFGIADLAAEFGVTARALRFYEDQGLLSPRRDNHLRIYSPRDRARLAWVLRGKSAGFSLTEIREMLDLYDLNDERRTQRTVAIDRCRARAEQLRSQLAEMGAMIDRLSQFADSLEQSGK